MKLFGTCAVMALAVGFSSSARAQGADAGQLEEVVVTARKVSENLQEVPVAVTAVSGADLESRQISTPDQLQFSVPNMSMQRSANDPGQSISIGLRGQMSSNLTLNVDSPVALYFDNFNIPRAYGFRQSLIDIDRIEVLRGPQGTLYGRNSTGGAVSIFSKDPTREYGGYLKAAGGSRNAYDLEGVVNLPLSDKAFLRVVGSATGTDGYGKNFFGGGSAGQEKARYIRAKFLWEPTDKVTVRLLASYTDSSGGSAPQRLSGIYPAGSAYAGTLNELAVYNGIVTGAQARAPGFALTAAQRTQAQAIFNSYLNYGGFYDTAAGQDTSNSFRAPLVTADIAWEVSDILTLRSISGYQEYVRDTHADTDGTPPAQIDTTQQTDAKFYSQELQAVFKTERLSAVLGVFAQHESGVEGSLSLQRPLITRTLNVPHGSTTNENLSFFAQGDYKFTDRLSLTLGARYTYDRRGGTPDSYTQNLDTGVVTCGIPVNVRDNPAICAVKLEKTFKEPTWLASANYKLTDAVLVYAKASRGFRAGGFNVRGASALNYIPYDPEITNEYEVGAKTELFDRRLRLNAAAFYTDYKNIQVNSRVFVNGQTASVVNNAASARIRGIEFEALARATQRLTVSASLSFLDPKYTEYMDGPTDLSGQKFMASNSNASLALDYVMPTSVGDLTPHLDIAWRSAQNFNPSSALEDTVTQRAYAIVNARVGLAVDRWDAELAVYASNLMDKKYIVGAGGFDRTLGYNIVTPAEPRSFGASIKKRF